MLGVIAVVIVVGVAFALRPSDGGSVGGCRGAVDALSARLDVHEIDAAAALASVKECSGPDEWKSAASADQVGPKLAGIIYGSTDTTTALELLCVRSDPRQTSTTCREAIAAS